MSLEIKIALCVVICDALDDPFKGCVVLGILALLYPFTDEIAHNASEILVAGIGHEGAAVGEHTDEVGDHTEVGKSLHLRLHTVALIVEPPARAELNLALNGCGLEIADHRADNVVILGVEDVKNCLGQGVCRVETV